MYSCDSFKVVFTLRTFCKWSQGYVRCEVFTYQNCLEPTSLALLVGSCRIAVSWLNNPHSSTTEKVYYQVHWSQQFCWFLWPLNHLWQTNTVFTGILFWIWHSFSLFFSGMRFVMSKLGARFLCCDQRWIAYCHLQCPSMLASNQGHKRCNYLLSDKIWL